MKLYTYVITHYKNNIYFHSKTCDLLSSFYPILPLTFESICSVLLFISLFSILRIWIFLQKKKLSGKYPNIFIFLPNFLRKSHKNILGVSIWSLRTNLLPKNYVHILGAQSFTSLMVYNIFLTQNTVSSFNWYLNATFLKGIAVLKAKKKLFRCMS